MDQKDSNESGCLPMQPEPRRQSPYPVSTISTHTAITQPYIEVVDIPTLLAKMLVLPSAPSCGTAVMTVTTVTFPFLNVTDVHSYVADVTRGCGYIVKNY